MIKVLELGCGDNPYFEEGAEVIHSDIQRLPHVEKVFDFNERFPFPNNFFNKVVAFHVLEHTKDLNFTIKEVHRVLKPGGLFHAVVPAYTSGRAFYEHHTRFFRYWSLEDYTTKRDVPAYGIIKVRFREVSRRAVYNKGRLLRPIQRLLEALYNKWPIYEDLWQSIPIKPIEFEYLLMKEE